MDPHEIDWRLNSGIKSFNRPLFLVRLYHRPEQTLCRYILEAACYLHWTFRRHKRLLHEGQFATDFMQLWVSGGCVGADRSTVSAVIEFGVTLKYSTTHEPLFTPLIIILLSLASIWSVFSPSPTSIPLLARPSTSVRCTHLVLCA